MKLENKGKIIKKFATSKDDTGSSQVQVAVLSTEIKELTNHLKEHKKDHSTRRGLIAKVNKRKKLLDYLKREDSAACEKLISDLKIRYQ